LKPLRATGKDRGQLLKLGNVILSPPLPTKAFYSQFKNRRNSIKVAHFVSQLFRKLIGFIDTSMQQWALHEFKHAALCILLR